MRDGKDKTIAALLAFFLGYLGIHRFYLGKTSSGVIRLLFCWTFIPGLLGFFEGIGLLLMDQRRFDHKYNAHLLPAEPVQVVYLPSAHSAHGASAASAAAAAAPAAPKLSMDEMKKALEDLQEMHIAGLITDEEFETQRQRVLKRFG